MVSSALDRGRKQAAQENQDRAQLEGRQHWEAGVGGPLTGENVMKGKEDQGQKAKEHYPVPHLVPGEKLKNSPRTRGLTFCQL